MSNPTKIYNDYVRANLPSTMTFDSTTDRYDINNHSFFSFKEANWYFKYVTKYGYISLSAYAVNNFDPDLVFDFKQNYYRTGGTETTLSPAVTHARAGQATMVDSDGLLKWAPHNLVTYSEDFTNSSWTKNNVSITANATTAPDGTLTADLITENSATGRHRVYNQINSLEGTRSCFFKYAGSTQWVSVTSGSNTASWVNIQTGVLGTIGSGTTTSVTDHGDGWYELSVYKDGASIYAIYNLANADGATSYTGDGTSGAYIWGAHAYRSDLGGMVNNSETGNSYVPTTSSPVYAPRVGHYVYNGSAWVNEGILHESEARTNLLTHSNGFTDSSWNRSQISTITANAGLSPDGTLNAYKVVPNTNLGVHYTYKDFGAISTNVYSFSVYVASAGYGFATVSAGTNGSNDYYAVVVDLSNGTKTATYSSNGQSDKSCTVEDVGSFYRVTISGQGERYYVVGPSNTGTYSSGVYGFNNFNGDGTSGILVYGAQLEANPTPSSYIPTSDSQVTRAAETLTVPAANLPYSSTNMSIQMDGKMTYADNGQSGEVEHYRWQLSSTNYIKLLISTVNTRTGQPYFSQRQSLSGYDEVKGGDFDYSPDTNVPFNVASRRGSTFLNGAHEGTLLTANTTPTALPDLSSTNLELGYIFMGTIGEFRMWSDDLGDVGITEATLPSTEPSLQLTFDGSSTSSFTVLDWSE